ncbi:MAG: hypothetical protein V4547_18860 [Bacteroidota bacterium]
MSEEFKAALQDEKKRIDLKTEYKCSILITVVMGAVAYYDRKLKRFVSYKFMNSNEWVNI